MTFITTRLGLVDKPHPGASILKFTGKPPALRGSDQENLLCGGCEVVLGKSISALTVKNLFGASNQLILVCPKCGANNVLPSTLSV